MKKNDTYIASCYVMFTPFKQGWSKKPGPKKPDPKKPKKKPPKKTHQKVVFLGFFVFFFKKSLENR